MAGRFTFTTSLEDDDDIQMDIQAARSYINGTMDSDLGEMCTGLRKMVEDLTTMQNRQYSKTGTNVDQDYADFEALTEALSDFLIECNRVLDDINSYIDSCEKTLYN